MLHAGQATAPCRRLTSCILLCADAACAVGLSAADFSCGTLPDTLQCSVQGKPPSLAAGWTAASCCAQTLPALQHCRLKLRHTAATLPCWCRADHMPGCRLIM